MQTSLEDPQRAHGSTSPDKLIDRLRNHLGERKIGYLQALQSHIPERAQRVTTSQTAATHPPDNPGFATSSSKSSPTAFPPLVGPLPTDRPFLLLDPPESIDVIAPLPDDPPVQFTWRRVTRKVIASNGPERITREWWRELGQKASRSRDYYKVRAEKGGTFWLFRNGLYQGDENSNSPPQWYMHGFFG